MEDRWLSLSTPCGDLCALPRETSAASPIDTAPSLIELLWTTENCVSVYVAWIVVMFFLSLFFYVWSRWGLWSHFVLLCLIL